MSGLFVTFQLWRDSGKDGVEELNAEVLLGEEDDDISDDEREEEEDGRVKHVLSSAVCVLMCLFTCDTLSLS